MIIDCGFWDINGDYIEDYQELNEIEAQEVLRKPKKKGDSPNNSQYKKS